MAANARCTRLFALVRKEFQQMRRDSSSFLIAFVLPLILLFLFGYGLSLDVNGLRLGMALEDDGGPARDLLQHFDGSPDFRLTTARSREELFPLLDRGAIRGIVIIPQDFSRRLAQGTRAADAPAIHVITDGSEPGLASFVENYVRALLSGWAQMRAQSEGRPEAALQIKSRTWYNPDMKSRFFLVPGSLSIILSLTGTILTSLVIAREWDRGTMESLLATPTSALEIVAGKIIPYFVLGMLSLAVCAAIAIAVFGLPLRGSLFSLAGIAALFLLGALGQGLFLSSIARNQFLASTLAILTAFMPAVMLSGAIYEISAMPAPVRAVTALIPARYLVSSLKTIFLVGDIPAVLWPDALLLALFAAVWFLLTVRVTKKRLE